MVGGISTGCAACKRRKIKCDERRPNCFKCEKSGRECPGPASTWRSYEYTGSTSVAVSMTRHPLPDRSTLLSMEVIERLKATSYPAGFRLQVLCGWLGFIPPRIGHSATLSAALKCMLRGHDRILSPRSMTEGEIRDYSKALALLNQDIALKRDKASSETACAAMILSILEIVARRDIKHCWVTHAGGVAALLEARGPDSIVSEFDFSIFYHQYSTIIMTCIFGQRDCFLTLPAWKSLHQRCIEVLPSAEPIVLRILEGMAQVPALLNDLRALMRSGAETPDTIFSLRSRVLAFRNLLRRDKVRLYSDLLDPNTVKFISDVSEKQHPPWLEPGPLFRFPASDTARKYMIYWSNLIISCQLMMHIDELSPHGDRYSGGSTDPDYCSEARDAADNIYRSVLCMHDHRPFGAFPMTFAFSTAFSVDQKTLDAGKLSDRRLWILSSISTLLGVCGVPGREFPLDVLAKHLTGS
ncbi:hypothetical protein PV11_09412 [Exophiala sideris]|uniref:Zn(2)-C6 fungal-type domain-containing protein n=1 Tax=Exophiala sideris TaxID=1016849 RepID=A0A0D1YA02_9EURO|nr:hypothetical protein PV11_09412 [Exophiala sideris]